MIFTRSANRNMFIFHQYFHALQHCNEKFDLQKKITVTFETHLLFECFNPTTLMMKTKGKLMSTKYVSLRYGRQDNTIMVVFFAFLCRRLSDQRALNNQFFQLEVVRLTFTRLRQTHHSYHQWHDITLEKKIANANVICR